MYIVATISKNSYTKPKVQEIVQAGAKMLRYNFSHNNPESIKKLIQDARDVIHETGSDDVEILADLPGAKMRFANFEPTEYPVEKGTVYTFKSVDSAPADDSSMAVFSTDEFIPVNVPHVGSLAKPGETMLVGDGEVAFKVIDVIDDDTFTAQALNTRYVPSMKAIHLGSSIDEIDHMTDWTKDHIAHLHEIQPEWIAWSFVRSADDIKRNMTLVQTSDDWQPKIMAKIETVQGVQNIAEICDVVDAIMIARGDLGLLAPTEKLGIYQKKITKIAKEKGVQVIVATQVLDSLLSYYVPQRAEILDLTNIVMDGADGILLAKETGISMTPGYSVETALKIIKSVKEEL